MKIEPFPADNIFDVVRYFAIVVARTVKEEQHVSLLVEIEVEVRSRLGIIYVRMFSQWW